MKAHSSVFTLGQFHDMQIDMEIMMNGRLLPKEIGQLRAICKLKLDNMFISVH